MPLGLAERGLCARYAGDWTDDGTDFVGKSGVFGRLRPLIMSPFRPNILVVLVALFGRPSMGASLAENGCDGDVKWPGPAQNFTRARLQVPSYATIPSLVRARTLKLKFGYRYMQQREIA